MIDLALIRDIVNTYEKHGWALRRVLLSTKSDDHQDAFDGVAVEQSDIEAIWFSRSSKNGSTAWEIRHMGTTPLAFLTVIEDDGADADERISETEHRLREAVERRNSSGTASA